MLSGDVLRYLSHIRPGYAWVGIDELIPTFSETATGVCVAGGFPPTEVIYIRSPEARHRYFTYADTNYIVLDQAYDGWLEAIAAAAYDLAQDKPGLIFGRRLFREWKLFIARALFLRGEYGRARAVLDDARAMTATIDVDAYVNPATGQYLTGADIEPEPSNMEGSLRLFSFLHELAHAVLESSPDGRQSYEDDVRNLLKLISMPDAHLGNQFFGADGVCHQNGDADAIYRKIVATIENGDQSGNFWLEAGCDLFAVVHNLASLSRLPQEAYAEAGVSRHVPYGLIYVVAMVHHQVLASSHTIWNLIDVFLGGSVSQTLKDRAARTEFELNLRREILGNGWAMHLATEVEEDIHSAAGEFGAGHYKKFLQGYWSVMPEILNARALYAWFQAVTNGAPATKEVSREQREALAADLIAGWA